MDALTTILISLGTAMVGAIGAWFVHTRSTHQFFDKRYKTEIESLDARLKLCEARHQVCEAEVEALKARVRLSEHDTIAVIAADAQGRITDSNIAASRIFKRSRNALIGSDVRNLIAPSLRPAHDRAILEMMQSGRPPRQGWIIGRAALPNGREIDVEVSIGDSYYNEVDKGWVLIAEIRELKTTLINPNIAG